MMAVAEPAPDGKAVPPVTCEVCGAVKGEDSCTFCGTPGLPPEIAKRVAEASAATMRGDVERAISLVQGLLRDSPTGHYLPHLRLADAFVRKAAAGQPALHKLAEREFEAALKAVPPEREAHLLLVEVAARFRRLDAVSPLYEKDGLPFVAEARKMVAALEGAAEIGKAAASPGTGATEPGGPPRGGRSIARIFALASSLLVGLAAWYYWNDLADMLMVSAPPADGSVFVLGQKVPGHLLETVKRALVEGGFIGEGQVPVREFELAGHTGAVTTADFSPDGKTLVTGGNDRTVRLWDLSSGVGVEAPPGGDQLIIDKVAFHPSGAFFTGVDVGGTICVWRLKDGQPLPPEVFREAAGRNPDLVFSPNGKLHLTVSWDTRAVLGNVEESRPVTILQAKVGLRCAAFDPSGRRVAYGTVKNIFVLWDLASGRRRSYVIPKVSETADISAMAFSPDGRSLVMGLMDSSVIVWDMARRRDRVNTFIRNTSIADVDVAPDGRTFAVAGVDGKAYLYDLGTGERKAVLEAHEGWVRTVRFSPDGKRLVTTGDDGRVVLWKGGGE